MTSKFKIGDKVRLINQGAYEGKWGGPMEVVRTNCFSDGVMAEHPVRRDGGFNFNELELVPEFPVADEVLAAELRHVVLRHWELVEELRARGYRTMCTRNVVTITKTETKSL